MAVLVDSNILLDVLTETLRGMPSLPNVWLMKKRSEQAAQ